MHRFVSKIRPIAVAVLLGVSLSACALGRSVIEVAPPASAAAPSAGPAVKITEVRDLRRFSLNPRDPSEPSIGEAAEINDPKITARIIGRKRGGFGAALGDLALPEGHTVQTLVRGAAQAALQEKGYRVVNESAPDYASALALSLDIEQFWAWFNPGMFSVTASNKARVVLNGGPVGQTQAVAESLVKSEEFAVTDEVWARVLREGLNELRSKIAQQVRPPSEVRR